ncbi:MAG: undecaprenyl diphosphate synthase family protein, partial [Clostridia bacterium]|nr:undecaprenyl diphosphate synthase family protein [Clostridia bacterium]
MDENKIPLHVGLIMDGNGRWAKKRLMPRSYGHSAGMDAMIKIAEYAKARGVKYLTVYTLST